MASMRPRIPSSAWYLAVPAITFVVTVVSAANRSTPSMFIQPLEFEFGWSAATIAFAIAVGIALFGLMGPFAASFMNKYGARRVVAIALAILAVSSFASIFMTAAWQLVLLWGFLSGIGTGAIGLALGATIANRWFERRRGLVMGVFSAGNATGQLIFLPLFAHIIKFDGWRPCAAIVGGLCLLLIPLFMAIVRERPVDVGLPPFGARTVVPAPPPLANPFASAIANLRSGLRSRDFWILGGTFAICGASTNGLVQTSLIPLCGDHGIPLTTAANLLAAMGLFDLIGTTASGWLTDRFDSRLLLLMYYGLRGLSLLALPLVFGAQVFGLPAFAVFYGLDWIATVPPTLKLANAAFGVDRGAVMFAWILAAHQIGASLAAYGAGLSRTYLGAYDPAFAVAGGLCLCAAVLSLFVARGRTPARAVAVA
ncbi:MAG TPA: MFS transporter [Candidatus Sulfotelmatobacter sp.]|nr:MFS transporter [Candidatus Sulfotelmatobacter sp.]